MRTRVAVVSITSTALLFASFFILSACSRSDRSTPSSIQETPKDGFMTSVSPLEPQDFKNDPRVIQQGQETDEMEKALAELPETSAIRIALKMKKLADEEDAQLAERLEKARSIAQDFNLGQDRRELCDGKLLKGAPKDEDEIDRCIGESASYVAGLYPGYSMCLSKKAHNAEMPCAHQVFLVELVKEGKELRKALRLASYAGVKVLMSHHFSKEPELVKIDVNAKDQSIIDFLLKGEALRPARPR